MENKRSIGVTIFGVYFIISELLAIITRFKSLNLLGWLGYFGLIEAIIMLILAINILRLKEWARKGGIFQRV